MLVLGATLVGHWDVDDGPGEGYLPCIHRRYLYRAAKIDRVHRKRYFITIDGTCRTWLKDDAAHEIAKSKDFVTVKPIARRK